MKRKTWLSEKEICDYFKDNPDCLSPVIHFDIVRIMSQVGVGGYYIPDFIVFGTHPVKKEPIVAIVEVKITACTDAITQVLNYDHVLGDICSQWADNKGLPSPIIKKYILARFFDRGLHLAAECAGIELARIWVKSRTEISVDWEIGEDPAIERCDFECVLDEVFGSFFPVKTPKSRGARNGANSLHQA